MTNKIRTYNTGKVVNHDELKELIKAAQTNGDWSKVEQANVSKVKDMFCLFTGVEGIENLNLDGWDTSNVTNMCFMFYKSSYNHPLDFDTSKVTDMDSMFYKSSYNHPLHFDTSNVTDMRYMFNNSNYNHPLLFNTSNVKDMENIFDNASITHPIAFKGGNIPDDIQEFINENNITYEEKCKLDNAIQNKRDDTSHNSAIVSSFKL